MHSFTNQKVKRNATQTILRALLFVLVSVFSAQYAQAHRVEYYTTSGYACQGNASLVVDAYIVYAPANTQYHWQYRTSNTGSWTCFVNGTNNINGSNFTVANATGSGLNDAPALTIHNPTSVLENVQVRVLMAENVDPCHPGSNIVWGGDNSTETKMLRLHFLGSSECGSAGVGGCSNNILSNALGYFGGFENFAYNTSTGAFTYANFGSTGVNTDFSVGYSAGQYQFFNNPYASWTGFAQYAPRSGNVQMIVYGNNNVTSRVWYKTMTVTPGQTYSFCTWASRVVGGTNYPSISLRAIPNTGAEATLANNDLANYAVGQWSQVCGSYTVPAGVTSVTFAIKDRYADKGNYNYSLDDVCIKLTASAPSTYCIGDKVFGDADGDGIQDAGEGGLLGVEVKLKNSNGTLIATTNTDANGAYSFCNLAPGNYTVVFPTTISGGTLSNPNQGTDDNLDSDPSQSTGEAAVTLGNANITNVDAGYCPTTLCLGNRVFADVNNNGTRDASEGGISGVTVRLYADNNNDNVADGAAIATQTTDANGFYNFCNLVPGNYIVGVVTPAGYASSTDIASSANPDNDVEADDNGVVFVGSEVRSNAMTLIAGTEYDGTTNTSNTNITLDFGFYQPVNTAKIGDFVFGDANGNSIQDATEVGIAGVPVQLFIDNNNDCVPDGAAIASTTTDANGYYQFSSLAATSGSTRYIVQFPTLAGYFPSGANVGGDDTKDSDADPVTGRACGIALTAGQNRTDIDAGYCPQVLSLGDRVFFDYDNSGYREDAEPGIEGLTVYLYRDANGDNIPDGAAIATTTTDVTGNYRFNNLLPGHYIVGVLIPAGYTPSTVNGGDPDNDIDRDNNGKTLVSGGTIIIGDAITLTAGSEPLETGNYNHTYDFGFFQKLNLGNIVWLDPNQNGIREAGETGINGLTVTLFADNNDDGVADGAALATTTTATVGGVAGVYNFANLNPGKYFVTVNATSAYALVATNGGDPDNAVDNDNNGLSASGTTVKGGTITLTSAGEPTDDGDGSNGNLSYDFALFASRATIGNFVWVDNNNNGIQDAGEPGLAGVTVELLDGSNNVLATTTTDANGAYSFTNLLPGSYKVRFTTPADYTPSTPNVGANDAVDSDPVGGVTALYTLVGGQNETSVDAGFVPSKASLGNFVWEDLNGNGIQDAGEPGIAGVTVTLYKGTAVVGTTTTDANGTYSFTNLTPSNNYRLVFTTPAGYTPTTSNVGSNDAVDSDPVSGEITGISLNSNQVDLSFDAGFYRPANLGDRVFDDRNGNGIQDATEPGLPGVTVTIVGPSGTLTTTTDINGNYSFTNLIPGSYTVTFTTPAGYTASPANQGSNDNTDSDPVGGTVTVGLVSGVTNNSVDAGFFTKVNLGNLVFQDNNNNGVYDGGIDGVLAGVTVNLYADANGDNIPDGAAIATTSTDGSGLYGFSNLNPGRYIVGVVIPAGKVVAITTANSGNPDSNTDNDNNGVNTVGAEVRSNFITLSGNSEPTSDGDGDDGNLTLDFGFKVAAPAQLGNLVFEDKNGNGIQDAGEPGIAGVTVTAVGPSGTLTTTTDANGNYAFTNLTPGSYTVTFTTPAGYIASPSNVGNDGTDSDPVGGSVTVVLNSGDNNQTVDAGFYRTLNLGNLVFEDKNGNGSYDPGIDVVAPAGTTVFLYADANGDNVPDGAAIATTTTDANGLYSFTNLQPGSYIVGVQLPAGQGLAATAANSNTPNGNTDGDNNGVRLNAAKTIILSNSITLSSGDEPTGGITNNTLDIAYSKDTDGDKIGDPKDDDDDNDGISDCEENKTCAGVSLPNADKDNDNDGVLNANDASDITIVWVDCNGDNVNDNYDKDFDGVINSKDLDADNDGVLDVVESGATAANANGSLTSTTDADQDGIMDVVDTDAANNANCAGTTPRNTDRTDVPDYLDADSDADGIPDVLEASTSPVGAAISVDANNDGRIDGTDADGDGVRSTVDAINGFGAAGQTPVNTDSPALGNTLGSDALPDYIDIDSDNDAIPDQIEGLSTPGYRLPSCIDADCDGMDDIYELPLADQGACPGANAGMGGITTNTFGNKVVISTDTDGIPDYRDTDSDNDGASDLAEATVSTSLPNGLAPATSVIADIDADGLSDLIDSYNRLTGTDPCCNNTNQYFGNNGGNNTGSCFGSSTRIGGGGTRSWRNGGVLPVDVIEFTGVYNNSIATLSWLVANEINLARYEVERSTDGVNFSTVGTVAAANAGSYRLNDNLSNISVAVVYYRLRSVDRDGSMKLSRVIPIRLASKIGGSIVISPNPANTYFVLTVKAAKDSKANIRVVDASGKVVIVDNRSLATGTNTITYSNIAGLAQGLYTVQVIVEGELQSQKLVVAH